jgi:hypothetical protein
MKQLAAQEAARTNGGSQQQSGSKEQVSEQLIPLQERLAKIQGQLDQIEKNLIIQQPSVLEFTRQVYPHMEAIVKRCNETEHRQASLEEAMKQHEDFIDGTLLGTEEAIGRLKTETVDLINLTEGKIVKDFQGYRQLIHTDLEKMLAVEKTCKEVLASCSTMTKECGEVYRTTSATIAEITETAKTGVINAKNTSVRAIEESRAKFTSTFTRINNRLWEYPIMIMLALILISSAFSAVTSWVLVHMTEDRLIQKSIEASTQTTQENLAPVIKKIEEQTRGLEQIYQGNENWEFYLSTLPANQRDSFRRKVQQGLIEQKQKNSSDMKKRTQ